MNRKELVDIIKTRKSFLCVGLDPDLDKMPGCVKASDNPIIDFNKAIIDATAPFCVAYKPNLAFYECGGLKGWQALEETTRYLRENYPQHFLIADAKRGDIGNTSRMYAKALFEELNYDAVTVAPYMGVDSVMPFLDYKGKWVVLLALTSNKGSADFQLTASADGTCLYESVLRKSQAWANEEKLMFVVGATQGNKFADVRKLAPKSFLLVPGVGAQGGSLEEVCRYGMTPDCGLLVNSSRAILYADKTENFAQGAMAAAKEMQQQMEELLLQFGIIST